jgi:hypothetical protein
LTWSRRKSPDLIQRGPNGPGLGLNPDQHRVENPIRSKVVCPGWSEEFGGRKVASDSGEKAGGGRGLWLAIALAAAVVIPRSIAISQAHSESIDDKYHLQRGLSFLARDLDTADIAPGTLVNDPPLGEGIVALPLWIANHAVGRRPTDPGLYDHPLGPEFILGLIAAWKALLFLPLVGVVFAWCRATYGTRSAWLAAALLTVEPNLGAHISIPALDVLGTEAIVITCFLAWRSFQSTSRVREILTSVAFAAALAIKHTSLTLPPILIGYAVLWWGLRPWLERPISPDRPNRLGILARTLGVAALSLWVLLLFDVSPTSVYDLRKRSPDPARLASTSPTVLRPPSEVASWPGGSYIRSVEEGLRHNALGHPGFLLGEKRRDGWRHYFAVVSSIKVPVGVGVLSLLSLASLIWSRPRWSEWGFVVPALGCLGLAITTKFNIGFRHFLPAYLFLLMLSTRCLVLATPRTTIAAWVAVAAVVFHSMGFHPDYLSYTNGLWKHPHLAISDSNLDWGQGVKEIRAWLDARPKDGRTIRVACFARPETFQHYLGDLSIEIRNEGLPMPTDGLLIVSPVFVAGPYDKKGHYAALQKAEPIDTIGHSLLVFDLDLLNQASRPQANQ